MQNNNFLNQLLSDTFKETGTFVEVGAHDGETYSKTCYLADSGWKGYYFEPVLEYAYKCQIRHKDNDITVIPVAIGNTGIKKFYKAELLSTLKGKRYQKSISKLDWFKGSEFIETKVASLSALLLPKCDLLIIDTEGSELNILRKMKIHPKIIVIELHEKSKEWQNITSNETQQCLSILDSYGYTKVYSDEIDSIFISNRN